MEEWYIKLFRKFKDWWWYDDKNVKILFLEILLSVNHTEKKWRNVEIKPWEMITSVEKLSLSIWLSIQEVRTALKKLKSTNEITIKTTNNFTLIKVNKWNDYQKNNNQNNNQLTNKTTNEQQTNNNQLTTTKEWKECKNIYKGEEMKKFAEENYKNNQTAYLLRVFFNLWYVPSKEETVESFRKWFKEKILDLHNFHLVSDLVWVIDNFETYWFEKTEREREKKIWKTTFMNNPYLNKFKK